MRNFAQRKLSKAVVKIFQKKTDRFTFTQSGSGITRWIMHNPDIPELTIRFDSDITWMDFIIPFFSPDFYYNGEILKFGYIQHIKIVLTSIRIRNRLKSKLRSLHNMELDKIVRYANS